jgi:hypothetical protein
MDTKYLEFESTLNFATCWLAPFLTALYILIFIKLRRSPMDSFMMAILLVYWVTLSLNLIQKFISYERYEMMDVSFAVVGQHIIWIMLSIIVFEMLRFKYVLTFNDTHEQIKRARRIKICKYVVGVITLI